MRILIFGASGFIGNYLTNYLVERNYIVIEASRSDFASNLHSIKIKWRLGDEVPNSIFKDVDFVIHLAHDFSGLRGAELTKKNILLLIKQAQNMGVSRQLFFSSYSAGVHSNSIYGLTKFEIENHIKFDNLKVQILRPGLVIGSGGIYGKISRYAKKVPVILLPDGGKGFVPTISIKRLCDEVVIIMQNNSTKREFNLFYPKLHSLRYLIKSEMMKKWKYILIINIPSSFLIFLLRIAEFLKLTLPINSDNLKGFLRNQNALHISDLKDQDEKYF